MSVVRPVVNIYSTAEKNKSTGVIPLPHVFLSPIRPDLLRSVFSSMAKNKRQAYGVSNEAGHQTSAESWGTGRAVARIPRVSGGGTHRAGQAAFGNMCRGGHMFNPNKTWRRWHRKINLTQKRHAVASALAATGCTALVMARGHRIEQVPELPLIVSDEFEKITKTSKAIEIINKLGLGSELDRVTDSKKTRAGKGKNRGRKYKIANGPLVIYGTDNGIRKAVRNIPGVDTCNVERLNLLKLAPGGNFGRIVIFTESAIKRLNSLWGSFKGSPIEKKNYILPKPMMTNADLNRIINSNEIQPALRPARLCSTKYMRRKVLKNPLKNKSVRCRLNPAMANIKKNARLALIKGTKANLSLLKKKEENKKLKKSIKKSRVSFDLIRKSVNTVNIV